MRSGTKRVGVAMAGLLTVLAVGLFGLERPIRFDASWTEATRSAFERATGLTVTLRGPVDVTLFPRPTFVAHEVAIGGNGGPVDIQAPAVRGFLSWPALLMGRSQVDKLEIENAGGVLDADTLLQPVRGPAGASSDSAAVDVDPKLPSTVTITAGLLQVRSRHPGLSGFLMDLHLLIDGVRGGAGSISGGATWHGERATVTARFDSLPQFLQGRPTSGTVKLRSPVVSASATGSFDGGWNGPFKGSISLSSPALSSLLRMAGLPPGVMAGIEHFSFSGTSTPTPDGVAFEDAHLAVNDDTLEGSLAAQLVEGRLNLVGTLATDKLDIGPFVATLPPIRAADGSWNTEAIPFSAIDLHDTDLRLSVGRLILNDVHADDVALSLLCRKGRMELSLGEARAFGGLVKARLFTIAGESSDDSVKADLSWSQVDVASLAKDLPGLSGQVAGSTSGYLSVEGTGGSAGAIVRTLGGKGNASWRQGQVQPMPVVDALLQDGPESSPVPVSFDLATMDFTIAAGLLSIGKGSVSGADTHLTVEGETYLPGGTYRLSSLPAAAAGAGTDPAPPAAIRRVAGAWGGTVQRLGAAPDLRPRPSPAAGEGADP